MPRKSVGQLLKGKDSLSRSLEAKYMPIVLEKQAYRFKLFSPAVLRQNVGCGFSVAFWKNFPTTTSKLLQSETLHQRDRGFGIANLKALGHARLLVEAGACKRCRAKVC